MGMTGRERVLAAINHREPDKVPLSIGSTSNDCFTKVALRRFAEHIGLGEYEETVTWKAIQTVKTPEKIQLERPLGGLIDIDDINKYPWPKAYDEGRVHGLREEVEALYNNTEFALVADYMVFGPFEAALWVRGWEDFLCDLYTEPKLAEALMEKILEFDLVIWGQLLDSVGDLLHVVCQGDDLAMQDRPIISPELYRKHIKKYHQQLYSFIRSKTKAKIMHHSCGSVHDLIPDLIDCGVDILNPVQTSAKNMEPERLKKEFGDVLTFWGGLDIQKLLAFGTPTEVEEGVKKLMETFGPGGGYVFAPSHNIQPTAPVENMKAMFDAALKFRNP